MASLFFSFLMSASMLHFPSQPHPNVPAHYNPDWTEGIVILESDDTVQCQLRFNPTVPEGLLEVLDGGQILTLSVRDVKSFVYFDAERARYRRFITLPVPMGGYANREMFLEYVYGNEKVIILNHRSMGYVNTYMEFSPLKQPAPVNRQYLLEASSGRLLPLSRQNALDLLGHKAKLESFIHANGIRFRKVSDFVRIFQYHDTL